MNLVDMIKGQLSGDTVSRLASAIGSDPNQTSAGINAAVPAILAGLTKCAGTSEGASRLASAVDNFDDRESNPAQAFSAGGKSLIEGGNNVLGSLLGGGVSSGITSVLSKFTGMGSGMITTLLGFCTPLIMNVLKGRKQAMGLDAGGLSNLLDGQKQNIVSAMPAGLGSALGALPGFGGFAQKAQDAKQWVGDRASEGYDTGRKAVSSGAGSAGRWLIPLLGLAVLIGLVWWVANRNAPKPTVAVQTPPRQPVQDTNIANAPVDNANANLAAAKLPGSDMLASAKDQISGFFKSSTDAFSGITDAASAEAAIPKLQDLNAKLDSVRTAIGALPADTKAQATSQFTSLFDSIKPTIDKVMAIPGVADKIKPVVDEMMTKFNGIMGR
jgi:hypothetical protein